jgi:hypothetical protein
VGSLSLLWERARERVIQKGSDIFVAARTGAEELSTTLRNESSGQALRLNPEMVDLQFEKEVFEMKLNVKAFALTCAIIWGVGLFVLTWWIIIFGGATGEPTLIGRLYLGYCISPLGSLIGLVWAFVDGLVGGAIFAWLYNLITARFSGAKEAQSA